jgi:hypothetical protein
VKTLKLAAALAAKIMDKKPDITKEQFYEKMDDRLDDNNIAGDFDITGMYAVIAEASLPSSQVAALPPSLQEVAAAKPALAETIKKMSSEQLTVSHLILDSPSFNSHPYLSFIYFIHRPVWLKLARRRAGVNSKTSLTSILLPRS